MGNFNFAKKTIYAISSKQHTHTSHHPHTHTQQSATSEHVHPPKDEGSAQRKGPGVGAPRTQKGEGGTGRKPSWGCWLLRSFRSATRARHTQVVGEARGRRAPEPRRQRQPTTWRRWQHRQQRAEGRKSTQLPPGDAPQEYSLLLLEEKFDVPPPQKKTQPSLPNA